jgi:ketosteroid isomerase-like protein
MTISRADSRLIIVSACIAVLTFLSACQQQAPPSPDTRAADEAALKQWDENWAKAASAKDVDKTVSYYADDAMVQPPNGPLVTSKAGIRKVWAELLALPGFAGGWKPTKVEVARSGEIAYIAGTWEFKWNGADGKPAGDKGKYLEVVKKQADGSWKCVNDTWNSDLPLPAPSPSK